MQIRFTSLKRKIVLWSGGLTILVFGLVLFITSASYRQQLEETVYHDLLTKNKGYVHTIQSLFNDRAVTILSLRDDLELYENPGQMWVHLASHTGEKVFTDRDHSSVYARSYQRKLNYYKASGNLSGDMLTPQLRAMLHNMATTRNSFGDGLKYFYIGIDSQNPDPLGRIYDRYQDSSLWVPDPSVDAHHDPLVHPWYVAGQVAGRDHVEFTEPYAERRTGEAVVSGATTITVDGIDGSLAGAISIKPIMDSLLKSFNEQAHITIISRGVQDETGGEIAPPKYVYSSRDATLGNEVTTYNDHDILNIDSHRDFMDLYDRTRGSDAGVIEWTIGGSVRLMTYHMVPGVGWKIFTSVSKQSALQKVINLQSRNVAISLVGLLLLLTVIYLTTRRSLTPLDAMRAELAQIANTGDLSKRITISSKDEVGQISDAINEMLDNTASPIRELGIKVKRIANGNLEATGSIDAKGDVAELVHSFGQMNQRLIEFEQASRDASPLTGLPGGMSIERDLQRRIDQHQAFSFCMFDLDNFKPFNDRYGYSRGNLVIRETARLLQEAIETHGSMDDFCGHVGGDDFVLITLPEHSEAICNAVLKAFDLEVVQFYDAQDIRSGGIVSQDRQGRVKAFDIMSITACIVPVAQAVETDAIRIGEIAAELKSQAKKRKGSTLIVNRRGDNLLPEARIA